MCLCVCVWKWLNVVTQTNDTWQPTIEIMFDNRNRYTDTISHCLILLPACLAIVTASQPASQAKQTNRQTGRQSKTQNNFNHHSFVRHKLSMAIDTFFCFCFCCCCCIFFMQWNLYFCFFFFFSLIKVSAFLGFFLFLYVCLAIVFVRQRLDVFYFCTHTHIKCEHMIACSNKFYSHAEISNPNKQTKKRGSAMFPYKRIQIFHFISCSCSYSCCCCWLIRFLYMPVTRYGVSKPKHACSVVLFLCCCFAAAHKHSFVIFLLFVKK